MEMMIATLVDEEAVYDFVCVLEQQIFDRDLFHKAWKHSLMDSSIQHFIAYIDNKAIGFCSLRILYHLHHCANVAQIEEFVIVEAYRRKGYASAMFTFLKEQSILHDCLMIELSSSNHRTNAHAFYESQGMKACHRKFTYLLQ